MRVVSTKPVRPLLDAVVFCMASAAGRGGITAKHISTQMLNKVISGSQTPAVLTQVPDCS